MFIQYDLWDAIVTSTWRIAQAFLLASALALPLGILMGAFEPINRLFEPIVAPLRYMPISAFIPLLILWFGIYEKQKIAFLFLGVFVYLLPVVVTAIRAVPEELVQTALTLGATKFQAIRTVLLPAALPEIFDSFRVMNAISVDLRDPRGGSESRARPRLHGGARAHAPESVVVVRRPARHWRHRPADRLRDPLDLRIPLPVA